MSTEADKTSSAITVEVRDDGVAVITFDQPGTSANTLRHDTLEAFTAALHEVENHPDVRAGVLRSAKKDFILGADIHMLADIASPEDAEAMVRKAHAAAERLRASRKPIVAAIHGQALGGGFELAMHCHGRVLSSSSRTALGLPEVQLGLLPGLNGLQRLAQLAGFQVALDHGLTGKRMRPKKAKKLGVVQDVVPEPILVDVAADFALRLADEGAKARNKKRKGFADKLTTFALEKNPLGRKVMFNQARETVRKKTGGHYPAAERIIDVLEALASDGFAASKDVEAKAFGQLLDGSVSEHLIGIYFATEALKKDPGVDDESVEAREVDKIGMLGAGLMGAGIAYVSIDKGYEVRLKDRDHEGLGRGLAYITDIVDNAVKKKRLSKGDRLERMARLSTTVDYAGMGNADLIIEAVFEDLDLKHRILAEVEEACGDDVIFASNTSSLPIARIAEKAKRPQNVVGMHYFSPVHKMPLLEVIRTEKTSDEAVATAVAVGKRQGKTVIVVNDGVGFYTSRILGPYMNEASYLLTEGVPVKVIDRAMIDWGWPVGPLKLVDEVGMDVAAHVGPIMVEAFGERMAPPPTIGRLVDDGRKGRKNGRGFYLYDGKKKGKEVDETVYAALGLSVPDDDASPVSVSEIQQRCNLQFINEAMHCWGEGILRSARDGDIGAIFGLGFPPFRGGPFRYLDEISAERALRDIRAYEERFGVRWTPAPALVELADRGGKMHG